MSDSEKPRTAPIKDTQAEPASLILGHLNQRFHECLSEFTDTAREAIADGKVPVLLRLDDRLILSKGEDSLVFEINRSAYHTLKALAHLPLLAYLFRATGHGPAEGSAAMQAALHQAHQVLDWQLLELGDVADLDAAIARVMTDEHALRADSDTFATVSAFQERCVQLAASDEVACLDEAMRQIRDSLGAEQWSEIHIVVCGGNQPRYKQLSKNFFVRMLKHSEGFSARAEHRVIYSENCQGLADAKALVADRLVNGRLAQLFLNSPIDLDEDVLGDAGLAAIDALFSQKLIA